MQIAVLERGFVYVGKVQIEGDWITITQAKNIRRWGTSKGLGQLALQGPQPETQLDNVGTVKAPLSAVIHLIECKKDVWQK